MDLQSAGRRALVTGGSRGHRRQWTGRAQHRFDDRFDPQCGGDEVALVITFLVSPRSVAINGDAIACGGGAPGSIHH